ncbi:FKBP-type peptidyl-prolyl cis-trans isomerase [Pseudobacteriovorax antillogorgiicola]|uniref:Peptidyl-prolyl cis-trans isomerase n=1 Tax=Pseudobacteriovorax antillogorgiicola TaxID=1513793 RepID=A0A1Y6CQA2_9BACT|nr:peptidylprolyl isomerase [Pseudobacteriovorax antillogorgiicola]TCS42843.1 FKBP-type peptidyl prolyl cis-trans isomerase /apo-metallochaperone SlyD [Pseudobacteriovorax antillogorgiicola]SMF81813.1 FKBP-type peptidyl prolyl cis-trans isomerase /Apo-metallochaperone SlyD [Pseudobacteriovorax antillogorgiicola]
MVIDDKLVVLMEYKLTDNDGKVIDQSDKEPLAYLHGSGQIIPGLEKELKGKKVGDALKVTVAPEEGYGEFDPSLLTKVEKEHLAAIPNLQVGMQVQGESPEGVAIFTVTEIGDKEVTLDANHPLAGQTLNFDVKVVEVRAATQEELDHGHAHGAGGAEH